MDQLPKGWHYRRGTPGRRATIARNPRQPRRGQATPTAQPPAATSRQGTGGLGVGVVVAGAITIGALTLTGSLGGSAAGGRNSLTVQVKADLNQVVAALAALGFHSERSTGAPSPSYATNCAKAATGGVKQFLTRYPCKEYTTANLTARRQGATAQVAITWLVMPTPAQAGQYKAEADTPGQGNPPGESAFNGRCYASGQDGATVWTEQVEPTGNLPVNTDRQILQAGAPGKLAPGYLQQHCIG